jgi:hypothetical protein
VAPFISSIANWLRGKPGDKSWFRMYADHRAERLVGKYGVDKAEAIVRLGLAMSAEKPNAESLLAKLRPPLDDALLPPFVVIAPAEPAMPELPPEPQLPAA